MHDHDQDAAAEGGLAESDPLVEQLPARELDSEDEEEKEQTKEESASKFPFF